ncbi:MAG: exodeoxyribonuclease VII small subunit [Deltaproteobacteria bacterium]|nr:MAG: exodeoxyribonuclease VII small subunit [Deltaproteobacteria bacterium]
MSDSENFEQSLKDLEALVERLESGDLPLEESLACFEQGVALAARCQKQLQQAEARIEQLVRDRDGQLKTEPFEQGEA